MLKKLVAVCLLSLLVAACSNPPSKEQVKESVKRIIPMNFEVLQVAKLPEIPGLYEVVIRVNNQPVVLYVDKSAKYVVSGTLMALESKTNLTIQTQQKFMTK